MAARCIIVLEGETNGEVYEFDTPAELTAFERGLALGIKEYGGGSWAILTEDDYEHQTRFYQYLIHKYLKRKSE